MNVLICNVPLRSEDLKTTYPPLGAMFILQTLISKGFDTTFYDINLFRPSDVQIVQHLKQQRPDVVGISATVSTSYYFTKKLTSLIKQILPNAIVIVGGAITTSSELLLRFTQADLCVIGEGEHTIVHLLKILSQTDLRLIDSELENIAGISFLDRKDKVRFTGYAPQLSVDEIPDPDYDLLDKFSRKDAYLIDSSLFPQFRYDQRFHEPFRKYKRLATVIASRGCVARCTFCHRFQKGLRVYPVDRVIKHIQLLREKYDVEFISFGDEDFGASKKWVGEFIEKIKPLNILYRISATRVDHVTLPLLKQYRDSGCVQVQHGFESGSDRILKVMEKRTLVDMNTNAALWIKEAGMQTIPSIVVGMPGETNKTISETINFLKKITEGDRHVPQISSNLLVALPGTPVYEYARLKGFLGSTLAGEEKYLLRVSDQGGGSPLQFNFTDTPYFIVQSWASLMLIEVLYHYYNQQKLPRLSLGQLMKGVFQLISKPRGQREFTSSFFSHPFFFHSRYVLVPLYWIFQNFKECDTSLFVERCLELILWPFKKKTFTEYVSLRQFMNNNTPNLHEIKKKKTHPFLLRLGR